MKNPTWPTLPEPRKKPGPNQYDPRSYPTGIVVGIYDPETYEIDKIQIETQKQQDQWQLENLTTR